MPHSTSFHLGSNPLSSLDGDGESLREPSISGVFNENDDQKIYFSRCRWYGEQFYRCVLAESLFSNANGTTRGENLQADHMQAILEFPYGDCIGYIDEIKSIDVPGLMNKSPKKPYALLMTKIGAVLDQGDSGTRNKLAIMILNRGGTGPSISPGHSVLPPSPTRTKDPALDEDQTLPMYSMRLHEWGQRKKKGLDIDDKHLSFDPPLWEVILKVEGGEFRGKAKTRKRAQHIAAKQACGELKIDL